MRACFIGHRAIEKKEDVESMLKESVKALIDAGVSVFLFGSKSEFDDLAWKVVTKIKKEYSFIKRVYVRASHQHIDESYEKYLLESYEETYFPPKIEKAGRFSYVERNCEMIDCSTYCVFYYNEQYVPPLKEALPHKNPSRARSSGTKVAYEYAKSKKKEIINLYMER